MLGGKQTRDDRGGGRGPADEGVSAVLHNHCGQISSQLVSSKHAYQAEVNLPWTPHNLVSLCALRAQIPTRPTRSYNTANYTTPSS